MRGCRLTDEHDHRYLERGGYRSGDRGVASSPWNLTAMFYHRKARFGGMVVNKARRLRQLEGENGKLKQLLAEAPLDNNELRDLLRKNA